ncbi:unnamed protein product [Aureobasidium uvarum]|uniref:NmrA-like domain-containing protein n=1 Tax=Aureobasidium uvarum TaxID=2773716 RepID=A0A9N8KC03_9PEZI|nr:unnamed protein product [Aureobasidium uvarum]
MKTVALAGATTGFGLTVLDHFLKSSHPYTLVLLTRSPQPQLSAQGIDVRPVDYSDHKSLVSALHGVHTILSFIGGSASALQNAQLSLLSAAKEAGVTRFAPSEYAGKGYDGVDLYAGKAIVWDAVRKSGLQYTRFDCGIFMNTFATGTPYGESEALANLRPWNFVINMKAGTAELPASGDDKIVFTEMNDVARFVIASLELQIWPGVSGMRGDVKTYREVIAIAERVQRRKFLVREDSVSAMEKQMKEVPETSFYNQVRIALTKGWGLVGDELNKAFPNFELTGVEEYMSKWWEGVELEEASWGSANKTFAFDYRQND